MVACRERLGGPTPIRTIEHGADHLPSGTHGVGLNRVMGDGEAVFADLLCEHEHRVRGRVVSLAEWGSADGTPVLAWAGGLSSRYGWGWARAAAASHGVRLIIADRPGFGSSDADATRTISSTVDDVCDALPFISIDSFSVVGNSSGGPYALATAACRPASVRRVGVVAGVGVMSGWRARVGMSRVNRRYWERAAEGPHAVASLLDVAVREISQSAAIHPERRVDVLEASRQGSEHLARDAWLVASEWDFELEDVQCPVDLWHGALDDDAPLSQAQDLAARLEDATLHVWPDVGHEMPADAMSSVYLRLLTRPDDDGRTREGLG